MSGSSAIPVTEVARETIRLMAFRRISPTPENYAAIFNELSGRPSASHPAKATFDQLAQQLWSHPSLRGLSERLTRAINGDQWSDVEAMLLEWATKVSVSEQQDWQGLIRRLLTEWTASQQSLTPDRKTIALEQVLTREEDAIRVFGRLKALVDQWAALPRQAGSVAEPPKQEASDDAQSTVFLSRLTQSMALMINASFGTRLTHAPHLANEAAVLEAQAREIHSFESLEAFEHSLEAFRFRVTESGETLDQMFTGLVTLMQLLVAHVQTLNSSDRLVQRHTLRLQSVLDAPLTPDALEDAQRTFEGFLERQNELRNNLDRSKDALKDLVSVLLDRLGQLSTDTGGFSERVGGYADKLASTEDLGELSTLVNALVDDTRGMQQHLQSTQDELSQAREQVHAYESRVHQLEAEVESISELVKEDQLTGALNRRGLAAAFGVEAARCDRKGVPMSVSVLDLDNFKSLNDRLGHKAGDDALVHLSTVVRNLVRPTDIVARYGGEEFVILLPETPAAEAVRVMERVQRELTKRFYLHNNERVFITFSAGVAERSVDEPQDSVVDRADQAMYKAKRGGKNRVDLAEPLESIVA